MISELEDTFAAQVRRYRLPEPVRQLKFALDVRRKWAWDFAWPQFMVAVELQGLVVEAIGNRRYVRGGHGTVPGMINDMEKLNAGVLLGWSPLWFAQNHVRSNDAIAVTQRVLVVKGWDGKLCA
jgi:hypothetical protein